MNLAYPAESLPSNLFTCPFPIICITSIPSNARSAVENEPQHPRHLLLVAVMFKSAMNFLFEPTGVLVWLTVSICLGAVAGFLPAWHASRRPVPEVIGYE